MTFFNNLIYLVTALLQVSMNRYPDLKQGSGNSVQIPEDHELSIFTNQLYDGID